MGESHYWFCLKKNDLKKKSKSHKYSSTDINDKVYCSVLKESSRNGENYGTMCAKLTRKGKIMARSVPS